MLYVRAKRIEPALGDLVRIDRPLAWWKGWSMIVALGFAMAGWMIFLPGHPWEFIVPFMSISIALSAYILGERLLIEQRIYERGLVSRTGLPLTGAYVLPYVGIDASTIRTTPGFRWTDPGENHLPSGRALRCLPRGPVVRLMAPSPFCLTQLRRSQQLVPAGPDDVSSFHRSSKEWIFSFADPEQTAGELRRLIDAEEQRIGPLGWREPRGREKH